MRDKITQEQINLIWRKEWEKTKSATPQMIFGHRLFIDGYPIFKKYIPQDAKLILDIGGGTGRYGLKIAQDFPNSKVIIADILQESLDLASRLAKELDIENIKTQREDVIRLSFPDNYFDIVFCDVVIQYISDYELAASEMIRVLKPGGIIIVSSVNFWNLPHTFYKWLAGKKYPYGYEKSFTRKELKKLLLEKGMKIEAQDGFYFAYGIFRLKKISRFFRFLGRVCSRLEKIINSFTNRFISRYFGFEIFIVGKK